jgi:hypothetical protein
VATVFRESDERRDTGRMILAQNTGEPVTAEENDRSLAEEVIAVGGNDRPTLPGLPSVL